jgi:hypothetical protein
MTHAGANIPPFAKVAAITETVSQFTSREQSCQWGSDYKVHSVHKVDLGEQT